MRHKNTLFLTTHIVLGLLLVWMVINLITGTTPAPTRGADNPSDKTASPPTPSKTPPDTPPDYTAITERSLFGRAEDHDPRAEHPGDAKTDATKPLPLDNLILKGVIVGPPAVARAIIYNPETAESKIYKTDDNIDDLTLVAIHRHEVHFTRDNQTFSLRKKSSPAVSVPQNQPAAADRPAPTPLSNKTHYALAVMEDFLNNARITPVEQDGRPHGLEVSQLENMKNRTFFGLRNGDIITHINGQHLSSLQKTYQVMQKARNQPAIEMDIIRDQRKKRLNFNLR